MLKDEFSHHFLTLKPCFIQVVAITVAVILFIVETMPTVKDELANPNQVVKTTFFVAETICVLFFTVELVGKIY